MLAIAGTLVLAVASILRCSTPVADAATISPRPVLALADDFRTDARGNGAPGWRPIAGVWHICRTANARPAYCTTFAAGGVTVPEVAAQDWTDYRVDATPARDARSARASGVALIGRMQDTGHFYELGLRSDLYRPSRTLWYIAKYDGRWTYLAGGPFIEHSTDYRVRLAFSGNRIGAFVAYDGAQRFEALGSATDASYPSGGIGLRAWGQAGSGFRDVRVELEPKATTTPADNTIPKHVNTAEYTSAGDGGYTGNPRLLAPYLTWAADPPVSNASQYAALGIKLYRYEDSFKAYKSTNDYTYLDLMHTNPGAISKDCSGHEITFGNGAAIATDPRTSAAGKHFSDSVVHDAASYSGVKFSAWFEDDTDNTQNTDGGRQACKFSMSAWIDATKAMWAAGNIYGGKAAVIFNGLNLADYGVDLKPLLSVPQVAGGMWEACYGGHSGFGVAGDYLNDLNKKWSTIEDDELAAANIGKAFWCYNENGAGSSSSQAHRIYTYVSFLLTYVPATSVYQTAYSNPSGAHVEPETGFVPLSPLKAEPTDISQLLTSTGTYARQYAACYFKGSALGRCAVVVNADPSHSHAFPYAGAYRHTLTLSGGGVLDRGAVSFSGGAPPSSLGPVSAVIAMS